MIQFFLNYQCIDLRWDGMRHKVEKRQLKVGVQHWKSVKQFDDRSLTAVGSKDLVDDTLTIMTMMMMMMMMMMIMMVMVMVMMRMRMRSLVDVFGFFMSLSRDGGKGGRVPGRGWEHKDRHGICWEKGGGGG